MTGFRTITPTLLASARSACPRCVGRHVVALTVQTDSIFKWHECSDCGYLWALPNGWTPHPQPALRAGE